MVRKLCELPKKGLGLGKFGVGHDVKAIVPCEPSTWMVLVWFVGLAESGSKPLLRCHCWSGLEETQMHTCHSLVCPETWGPPISLVLFWLRSLPRCHGT